MKNGSRLKNWVALGKMGHTEKMGQSWKNASHLVKWIKHRKIDHTWENVLHFQK